MSRGPGRWQRLILDATQDEWVWLLDLLPPDHTRAEYVALNHAAMTLADSGKLARYVYLTGGAQGRARVLIGRPGLPAPVERPPRRLSVD